MDPTVCYKELCDAVPNGDLATAGERRQDLTEWLVRGGFYPEGCCKTDVDAFLEKVQREIANSSPTLVTYQPPIEPVVFSLPARKR